MRCAPAWLRAARIPVHSPTGPATRRARDKRRSAPRPSRLTMPRKPILPSYRKHKQSGQAVVIRPDGVLSIARYPYGSVEPLRRRAVPTSIRLISPSPLRSANGSDPAGFSW